MLATSFQDLMKQLKKEPALPVYVLHGEEPYFVDKALEWMEANLLKEEEKAFNLTIAYGKDLDYKGLMDVARRLPLMAEKQVLILREAQDFKQWDMLGSYFENPSPTTVLVLAHKHRKIDTRKKVNKALVDKKKPNPHVLVFESIPLRDHHLPNWVEGYLRDRGYSYAPQVPLRLVDAVGNKLNELSNEIDKLLLNADKNSPLSEAQVEEYISKTKSYTAFDFQDALGKRDVPRAVKIALHFAADIKKYPMMMLIGSLYGFYSKLYALKSIPDILQRSDKELAQMLNMHFFRVQAMRGQLQYFSLEQLERIFSILKHYDLRSKGTDLSAGDNSISELGDDTGQEALYLELVYRLLRAA